MVAVTALRNAIATALTNDGVWSVFSFPPMSPIANSVIIQDADPFLVPSNNSYSSISPMASFKITGIVPLLDNQGSLNDIEGFMAQIFLKLSSSSLVFKFGSVSAPTVLGVDAGQMLSSDLNISILTSWE
jgi:hypothetical protein